MWVSKFTLASVVLSLSMPTFGSSISGVSVSSFGCSCSIAGGLKILSVPSTTKGIPQM